MASRGRQRPGQHYLQSSASRTLSVVDLMDMSETAAETMFRKLLWPETDGEPICPHCGSMEHWPLPKYKRFKCKRKGCRKQFSIISDTPFAHHKMSYRKMLLGIYEFALPAKGLSAIQLSHKLKCDYKTAFVFLHKIREALPHALRDVKLKGVVEVDGQWFGGHIRPQNLRINGADLPSKSKHQRVRRVVVGARERGPNGRTIVNVFRGEHEARTWVQEHVDRMAVIMADMGGGWTALHATHKVLQVNHSERYADGDISTNQMESFFSRLGRFEVGTHHHIAGPYLLNYASDAAWRETHSRIDDRRKIEAMLGAILSAPRSRRFSGYWQHHGARAPANDRDDFFANFA